MRRKLNRQIARCTSPVFTISWFKPHSARTGTARSQLTGAAVRRKANDGEVYAIRAWFKFDTALSAVV